jgi:transcriptional regulator with XRE-family HTH domain
MVERILLVLKVKNLSPSKFADEIGIQRSSMSHIMSGRNLPSLDLVMKIMNKFPDINPEWLVMGIGQMMKSTQIDLFEESQTNEEKKAEPLLKVLENLPVIETINEPEKETVTEKAAEKTSNIPQQESKPVQNEDIKPDFSDKIILPSQPEIEKIVILYKNKSFKEYYPSL